MHSIRRWSLFYWSLHIWFILIHIFFFCVLRWSIANVFVTVAGGRWPSDVCCPAKRTAVTLSSKGSAQFKQACARAFICAKTLIGWMLCVRGRGRQCGRIDGSGFGAFLVCLFCIVGHNRCELFALRRERQWWNRADKIIGYGRLGWQIKKSIKMIIGRRNEIEFFGLVSMQLQWRTSRMWELESGEAYFICDWGLKWIMAGMRWGGE